MSHSWRSDREKGSPLALGILRWVGLHLGRRTLLLFLYPTAFYYLLFAGKARRASRRFLTRALGRQPGLAQIYRHLLTFAIVSTDRLLFLAGRRDQFEISVSGDELFDPGRLQGAVLLTAHFGSFDILRVTGRDDRDLRLRILLDKAHNANALALIQRMDPALAADVIDAGAPGPALAITLGEAIKRGELVGVMADRSGPGEARVQLPFFGEPADFPLGPWQMAAALRTPVIACFGVYCGGRRYHMHFERIGEPEGSSRKERRQAMSDSQIRYVQRLEDYARQHPYNWFNFYDFWHHDATADH